MRTVFRSTLRFLQPLLLSTTALVPAASPSTIVVDEAGGAFTDIQPAIAAAQDGDVILVMEGTYNGFSLQKGLSIIGSGVVRVTGGSATIEITSIQAGQRAAVVNLRTHRLVVSASPGTVIVQDMPGAPALRRVTVDHCADLRLRGLKVSAWNTPLLGFPPAVSLSDSRVEMVRCEVEGADGFTAFPDGLHGVGAFGGRTHFVMSSARGGEGEVMFGDPGGRGGHGWYVHSGTVIVAGTGQVIRGGNGAAGDFSSSVPCFFDGPPGSGILAEPAASCTWSGVVPMGGSSTGPPACATYFAPDVSGNAALATPADPSLDISGSTTPGSTVTFDLHAAPGSTARLDLGRNPIVIADGLAPIEDLAPAARSVNLGLVPPSGTRSVSWRIPANLPVGSFVVLQAEVVPPGGVLARTNSVPIVVR